MSGPRRIDELLRDPGSELNELTSLALLALWIDRASATAAELPVVIGRERLANIARALGTARGEVQLALEAHVERESQGPRR